MKLRISVAVGAAVTIGGLLTLAISPSLAQDALRAGAAAFGDWTADAPGVWRKITVADLPAPMATASARAVSQVVPAPEGAQIKAPANFEVTAVATGLKGPRTLRVAPNGDVFVAEGVGGNITVLRSAGPGKPYEQILFAEKLTQPYGLAFYPAKNPQWLYVGMAGAVIRYPYKSGDTKPSGPPTTIVSDLPIGGGHWTRDVTFSPDGKRLFIAVGSASNVAETMPKKTPDEVKAWEAANGLGATWEKELHRSAVLVADPEGKGLKNYATGLRNCSGMTVNPTTGAVWCTVNERDHLGDNLVPDYTTSVKEGKFYGWPWYYLGDHEDPRLKGDRPDLAGKVTVPDVLFQPHSAALTTIFYNGKGPAAFPAAYAGEGFTVLHGSWNRADRTGYKVVRVRMKNGVATGEYQDFLTGFVIDSAKVWGRPSGITVAPDGALLVSDDGSNTVWRVAYKK